MSDFALTSHVLIAVADADQQVCMRRSALHRMPYRAARAARYHHGCISSPVLTLVRSYSSGCSCGQVQLFKSWSAHLQLR